MQSISLTTYILLSLFPPKCRILISAKDNTSDRLLFWSSVVNPLFPAKIYTLLLLLETSLPIPLSLCNIIAEWTVWASVCGLNVQPCPQAFLLCILPLPCLNSSCALQLSVGHWSVPGEAGVHILTLLLAHMLWLSFINIPNPVVHSICHSERGQISPPCGQDALVSISIEAESERLQPK